MSNDVARWLVAGAVLVHAIGHVVFIPMLSSILKLQVAEQSWLLTPLVGESMARWASSLAVAVAMLLLALAAGGAIAGLPWWRAAAIAGAVGSIGVVVLLWQWTPTSAAFSSTAFDVVILVALLGLRWPPKEVFGV